MSPNPGVPGGDAGVELRAGFYVTDTMADARSVAGLAARMRLTMVVPAALAGRETNWPAAVPAAVRIVHLRGGRRGFVHRAARWLAAHRRDAEVCFVIDNLSAALAANLGHIMGGPPVVMYEGRQSVDYIRCATPQRGERGRSAHRARLLTAIALVAINERAAAGVGAVSEAIAAEAARRCRLVRAIPSYGVDTEVFAPGWGRDQAARRIGLERDLPVVMYRSRIAPEKDPWTFLRAIGLLRARGRRLHAVYMGGETEELAQLAAAADVEVLCRKPASLDDIPLWYRAADVCVQTSKQEGLGISVLEALACETPVVVTAVGGLPETVAGGDCGLLVPPGDAEAVAAAIARLLDEPELARRLASRGREHVCARYTAERAFADWVQLGVDASAPRRRSNRRLPIDGAPSASPRVLFVDHETRLSGGERDLVDLVGALDEAAVEIHVALPGEGSLAEALRQRGATVHLVRMSGALRRASRWQLQQRPWLAASDLAAAAATALRLARLARALRPAVVHTNTMKAHLLAIPAARASRSRLVWHLRDILQPGWLLTAFRVTGGLVADRIVCISEATAAPMRHGRAGRRVRVVHNGVTPRSVGAAEALAWRQRLGASDGDRVIGMVGQLARWKGQDVFLDAAALLAGGRGDLRFCVAGDCLFPENEAAFVSELRERVDAPPLHGRARLLGPVDDVDGLMSALDVAVHASRLPEPFGRVIVEAMAQGTPVVTTTIGAGPELVAPGAGRLVTPDDPAALAAAIAELLALPDRLAAAGETARALAARFTPRATAAGVLSVWKEIGGVAGAG